MLAVPSTYFSVQTSSSKNNDVNPLALSPLLCEKLEGDIKYPKCLKNKKGRHLLGLDIGLAMGGSPVLWGSFAHHVGNLVKHPMHFMGWRRTDNMEKRFSAIILTSKKLPLITTRVFSTEVSSLFVVVSGNNTDKNMEAREQMIKDVRRWLTKVDNLASEVSQRQLARLETSERVLRHIRLQNETDTHNDTYHGICEIFLDNIVLSTRAALISKETHNMSQQKSAPSEILPIVGEIKGYLKELESKNNEIDRVMNQIEEMVSYLF